MIYVLIAAAGISVYLWHSSVDAVRILARAALFSIILWSLILWGQW